MDEIHLALAGYPRLLQECPVNLFKPEMQQRSLGGLGAATETKPLAFAEGTSSAYWPFLSACQVLLRLNVLWE